jgi:hypothetical protein
VEIERTEAEIRKALSRLVTHGAAAEWVPDAQPLLDLTVTRERVAELGEGGAGEALRDVLRDAAASLGSSQYERLLNIVLALEPEYEGLAVTERREIAGAEFRGGARPVASGTIRQHHEPRALDQLAAALVARELESHRLALPQIADASTWFEWHPAVHYRWAAERLTFWRLTLPVYDSAVSLQGVSSAMRRSGVHSWALYGLLGGSDLLVRAWLTGPEPEVRRALEAEFSREATVVESFLVDDVVCHWLWNKPDAPNILGPTEAALRMPLDAETLERLQGATAAPELVALGVENGLASVATPEPGAGFMTVVSQFGALSIQGRRVLRERILSLVNEQSVAKQVSVYEGLGFGSHLVLGTVTGGELRDLHTSLIQPLISITRAAGSRVATYVMPTSSPVAREERLVLSSASHDEPSVRALLERGENEHVEIKAFAFADVGASIEDPDASRARRDATAETLLRAVAGFLNGGGGTLLIGAVDRNTVARAGRIDLSGTVPVVGDYLVVGIDDELGRGWDFYSRRLRELCDSRIDPSPHQLLSFSFDKIEERLVCVITVMAGAPDRWFWVKSGRQHRFYVRRGALSQELSGPELDQYRATVRREPERGTEAIPLSNV